MSLDGHDLDAADDLRASMRKVVQYVLTLELPRARWERVEVIIEAAAAAAAAGDLDGLRTATDDLMLVIPVRIIRGDVRPSEPADQKILERANALIHALAPMRPAAAEGKDGAGQ